MVSLKYAARTLLKTPFVTAVAILSLALGIGANAAIFSLFDQVLLRPLPVSHPEQLVNLTAPGPKPNVQGRTDLTARLGEPDQQIDAGPDAADVTYVYNARGLTFLWNRKANRMAAVTVGS